MDTQLWLDLIEYRILTMDWTTIIIDKNVCGHI
jgi:hypothetical protein